jgi:hypothetical protein
MSSSRQLTDAEVGVAELGEQLFAVSDPSSVARKAPTVAKLMQRRRQEVNAQAPPEKPAPTPRRDYSAITNDSFDRAMQERPA